MYDTSSNPALGLFGLILLAVFLVAAVKTAMNGRWVLFVVGFFCTIAWIVGWASGPRRRY